MRNGVTEQELIEKAKGERVTLESIEAAIIHEHYFTAADGVDGAELNRRLDQATEPFAVNPAWRHQTAGYRPVSLGLLTICVLTLWNGWTILGKSACADPANFNEDLGRRLAKTDAVNQIWPLMGYELKSRMARDQRMIRNADVKPQVGFTTYIGTKVVNARPMDRLSYTILRGWKLPADENGFDEGYLVEYTDRVESPPHVDGFQGYVSWSPKDVFERAYRPVRQAERSGAATAEAAE